MKPIARCSGVLRLAVALIGAHAVGWHGCPAARAQALARDAAAAEVLFQEAHGLMDRGSYREACPKLEESQRLDPGVGTLMYLGHCYERLGRIASAWSTYRSAESAATYAGQKERAAIARERGDAMQEQLVKLTIRVAPANGSDVQVARDGVVLGRAVWGVPVPVDPGQHVVTASAAGKRTFSTAVEVSSSTRELVVDVPVLQSALESPGGSPATPTDRSRNGLTSPEARTRPDAEGSASPARPGVGQWIGVGLGGLGLVGLGVGTAFALQASSKSAEAESLRVPGTNAYRDPGFDYNQQALDARERATWSFVLGGVLAASGAVLFLTAPGRSGENARVLLGAAIRGSAMSLELKGGW